MGWRLIKPWTWFWGLLAAAISGGAVAVTTGPVAALFAPSVFNLKDGLADLLWFMLAVFVQAGFIGGMFYLAKNPVPQIVEDGDTDQFVRKP